MCGIYVILIGKILRRLREQEEGRGRRSRGTDHLPSIKAARAGTCQHVKGKDRASGRNHLGLPVWRRRLQVPRDRPRRAPGLSRSPEKRPEGCFEAPLHRVPHQLGRAANWAAHDLDREQQQPHDGPKEGYEDQKGGGQHHEGPPPAARRAPLLPVLAGQLPASFPLLRGGAGRWQWCDLVNSHSSTDYALASCKCEYPD